MATRVRKAPVAAETVSPAKSTFSLTEKQRLELDELRNPVPASEFGGVFGTFFLTLALPVVIYWVWASINFNFGYLLTPKVVYFI